MRLARSYTGGRAGERRRGPAGEERPAAPHRGRRCRTKPAGRRSQQSLSGRLLGSREAGESLLRAGWLDDSRVMIEPSPLGPVWGMAREWAKAVGPRQVPAPGGAADFAAGGGQQSSTERRGTSPEGGVCCEERKDHSAKKLTSSVANVVAITARSRYRFARSHEVSGANRQA